MRLNEVLERFSLISGLEGEELSRYAPLCIDAISGIKSRVPKLDKIGCEDMRRLVNCAAALAFYKYTLYAPEGLAESFDTGSLSVKMSKSPQERARLILTQELRGAEDIVCFDDDFVFKGVAV